VAEFRTEALPEASVVEAAGEIDIANVAELTRRVLEALAEGATAVVLDLCNVTHLDSSGLAAVISAHQRVSELPDGRFVLVVDTDRMRRTFELRGLDRVFLIVGSRDAALDALREPGRWAATPPS
jgi:anti-sigma B factor antagonist